MRLSQRFGKTGPSDDGNEGLHGPLEDGRYEQYTHFETGLSDDGSEQPVSPRKQKKLQRREQKRQKAGDKKRRKEEKAAITAEEAYQMGEGSNSPTRRARMSRSLGRILRARFSGLRQAESASLTDEQIVAGMTGSENGIMDGDLSTSDGLQELLGRESGMTPAGAASERPNRWRKRGDRGPINEDGDTAQKTEAMPVTFDRPASTWIQRAVTGLLMAGLGSLVILALMIAFQLLTAGTGSSTQGSSSGNSAGLASATPLSPTQPAGRAAELAEGFAAAYMAYPGTDKKATEEYVASLKPYLHPEADPDLFIPVPGEDSQPTEVRYASATSVNKAAGEARYKVLVDARIQELPASDGAGEDAASEPTNETLVVYVKVPLSGSDAYVVAPPKTTETTPGPGAGSPGIYGYEEAQPLEEGPLKNTLQDFFEAAYSEKQSRPLVKEEMVEGASLPAFPPENRAYVGIKRSAIYYRDDLQAAQERGFQELYDVEVYVEVLDQDSGRTTLDAWSMTAGRLEEGGYKILKVN